MGRPKLLMPWGEGTVIESVLTAWTTSRVDRVLVVIDAANTQLADVVQRCGCEVVRADAPPDMKASVRCALEEIDRRWSPRAQDVWLLAPADFPTLDARWIDVLLSHHDPHDPRPLVPTCEGRRGHPVLFPWPLAAEVGKLLEDEGVKRLLLDHPPQEVPTGDSSMFADMNTPEEYGQLRDRFEPE